VNRRLKGDVEHAQASRLFQNEFNREDQEMIESYPPSELSTVHGNN
jgi:hypothetical protein